MLDKRVGHVLKMPKEPTIGGVKSTKLEPSLLQMLWNKPTPWLMLLLVLGKRLCKPKFCVKQVTVKSRVLTRLV